MAQFRAWQRTFERAVAEYPEIVGPGLTIIGKSAVARRSVLLFTDRGNQRVIVEPKWDAPSETEVSNLASWASAYLSAAKDKGDLVIVTTSITPEIRRSLDQHGIKIRLLERDALVGFLRERGANELAAVLDRRNFNWQQGNTPELP